MKNTVKKARIKRCGQLNGEMGASSSLLLPVVVVFDYAKTQYTG